MVNLLVSKRARMGEVIHRLECFLGLVPDGNSSPDWIRTLRVALPTPTANSSDEPPGPGNTASMGSRGQNSVQTLRTS